MVLFPSYLPHTVFPHQGAGRRIPIAFNLRDKPFP
jgi:Putative 2OG-Fe(II) oxygenase